MSNLVSIGVPVPCGRGGLRRSGLRDRDRSAGRRGKANAGDEKTSRLRDGHPWPDRGPRHHARIPQLHPRSETHALPNGLLGVTVIVRWIPLMTAAYGTRVARPARTTRLPPSGDGPPLFQTVRPDRGDPSPRGQESEGLAAVARRNLNCTRGVLAGALLGSTRPSSWADAATSSHPASAHPGVSRRVP